MKILNALQLKNGAKADSKDYPSSAALTQPTQFLPAKKKDWSKEYLSATVSVKSVEDCNDAINHINKYGTMHTDSIITRNKRTAKKFLKNIKSSIAMHNTSTQFADGGEFGFGSEVGISTNTLPPRGPVGLEQLVSYKYEVLGNGQIRKVN